MTKDVAAGPSDREAAWSARHPDLFAVRTLDFAGVGYGHLSMRFTLAIPPDELVSNVRVIGLSRGRIVVCSNDLGDRFLPGGTREPDETVARTAERELFEEAGAVFTRPMARFGAFEVHNSAAAYRSHLPHPVAYWLYVSGDVEVRRPPTNPADGENVTEVVQLPPEDALDYLARSTTPWMTGALRLFLDMRAA